MEPEKVDDKVKMEGGAPEGSANGAASAESASAAPVQATEQASVAGQAQVGTPAAPVAEASAAPATAAPAAETPVAPVAEAQAASVKPAGEKVNFWQTILRTFTKPLTVLREDLPKYGSLKNAGIFAGITLAASVLLSIVSTFFNVVFSYSCSGYGKSGTCVAKFSSDALEYWKFGTFLFETIASTIVVMLVLAGIFFGIAKLFKSQKVNFCRCLTVVSLAMLPMMAASFLAAFTREFVSYSTTDPGVFSVIMGLLTTLISMVGMIYAAMVIYEGMTREAELDGDKKVHYTLLATVASLVALGILVWLIGDKIGLDSFLPILTF